MWLVSALDVVLPGELRLLGPTLEPGLFKDRRHVRVGHQVLIALLVPVEGDPDAGVVIRITKDARALAAVLPSLLGA